MQKHHRIAYPLTAIAAALLAVFGSARAEEADEVKLLITPESEVAVGLGYVDNENQRWGKFTGMTDNGTYGLLDLNMVSRDDATGTWVRLLGRNLGLDHRDFRFEHNRQGDWSYYLEFSQIPFNQPLTILSRTSGIGTPVQNVAGLPFAVPVELDTRRDRFTLGVDKIFAKDFNFSARFRTEDKEGNRRFGRQGPDFLAEPVDWTTNQLDALFGYTGEKLQLQVGYYGTTFENSNAAMYFGGVVNPNNSVGLPPDNESHQAYLSGGYSFTPTTRATFKVSYTEYTQDEAFFALTSPPAGSGATERRSLDAKVDTTVAQAGIVSRPIPKLTLRADWRYENRDDDTPRLQYISSAASRDGFNVVLSRLTNIAKAEAQYLLPLGFRIIGGVDYDHRDREITPTLRQASWRAETEEWSYRLELTRSLSETINGRLSYVYSDRDGTAFEPANNSGNLDVIDPIHWAERKRDKWRLRLDWAPVEELAVQFTGDYAEDKYDGRPLGPEKGELQFYGLDATYALSDDWQLVGWLSWGENKVSQATIAAPGAVPPPGASGETWFARLKNTTDAVGLGVRGRPTSKLEIGADVQYQDDKDEFNLIASSGPLPDITNKHTTLTLFGRYQVTPNSGFKLEYIYDRWSTDDWAWQIIPQLTPTAFFTGNTVIFNQSPQQVHFIGASYYYQWR
jgi:MtrB/PioB family decaheme-associated outer membrane protein